MRGPGRAPEQHPVDLAVHRQYQIEALEVGRLHDARARRREVVAAAGAGLASARVGGSPTWYAAVPAESTARSSSGASRAAIVRNTTSAVGERQILAKQKKRIVT